jgi:uncharacterized coiled-coil DUF342 family protein
LPWVKSAIRFPAIFRVFPENECTIKKEGTMSNRDLYIEKAKAKIDQWNAEIDKMTAKVDEAEADTKIEYQKQLDEAREQRDVAEARLKKMRQASDDAWDDIKAGFDKAWDSISDAFDRATSRFK